jgi:hypothetical protein
MRFAPFDIAGETQISVHINAASSPPDWLCLQAQPHTANHLLASCQAHESFVTAPEN